MGLRELASGKRVRYIQRNLLNSDRQSLPGAYGRHKFYLYCQSKRSKGREWPYSGEKLSGRLGHWVVIVIATIVNGPNYCETIYLKFSRRLVNR